MQCPVCDVALDFEPWRQGSAADEICPSCGIQFGYNDARPDLRSQIYAEWRKAWIANDRRPIEGEAWHRISAEIVARVGQ